MTEQVRRDGYEIDSDPESDEVTISLFGEDKAQAVAALTLTRMEVLDFINELVGEVSGLIHLADDEAPEIDYTDWMQDNL